MPARDRDELRLATHLFESVRNGLTGRSAPEIVGVQTPTDRLHAGVLPAPRTHAGTSDAATASPSLLVDQEGSNTASRLGVDLLWTPEDATTPLRVEVQVAFSVYYPVLPTFEEFRAHRTAESRHEESLAAASMALEEPAPEGEEDVPSSADANQATVPAGMAEPPSPAATASPATPSEEGGPSALALPPKWRRYDVEDRLTLTLAADASLPAVEHIPLAAAIQAARGHISADPERAWTEEPIQLPAADLADDERYAAALARVRRADGPLPDWSARIVLEVLEETSSEHDPNALRLHVSLENETPTTGNEKAHLQTALFDARLQVRPLEGRILPFTFFGVPGDYRSDRRLYGLGANCVAEAVYSETSEEGDAAAQEVTAVRTETVPLFRQPWTRTAEPEGLPRALFSTLGTGEQTDPLGFLDRVSEEMSAYLHRWDEFLAAPPLATWTAEDSAACRRDRDAFQREQEGFLLGVECLRRDPRLLRAFRLMNDTFAESGRAAGIASWRLFQLCYIVLQVPSLAAREPAADPEFGRRLADEQAKVDVLLFPTGGGKTEAYLGLIVLALFFDRLRGKTRGATAWMRFPLRMLSLQQLDRVARVLAQAERIRAALPESAADHDPFSIGYFVGSGNTPNRLRPGDADREWAPLYPHCPFCNADGVRMEVDRQHWRLKHVCQNADCYTNTAQALGSAQGSLPVYIVDNEVYRYRPSVLVGTVDKLAILAFNRNFAQLFRDTPGRCPRHGYFSFGRCIEAERDEICTLNQRAYGQQPSPGYDPMPALLIEDEMHLLNEELGTFKGHYEGFLPYGARRDGVLPPKVLGATATVQAFETHVYHLYLRSARRFPAPGWEEGETFYSTRRPHRDRRLYAGILSHRPSTEEAVVRAVLLYQRRVRELAADPAGALASLGLTSFSGPDDFTHFLRLYDMSLCYVNRKAAASDLEQNLERAVEMEPGSTGIGVRDATLLEDRVDRAAEAGDGLRSRSLMGDNTLGEVREIIDRIERERVDTGGAERLDVLLATSIISHGVDLERINMMCMAGMPSRYAEYVQASSRSARSHVGLVFSFFARRDLREVSQYHYFFANHRYLDRLVEPVPINRFSAFAADKTVPGLLCGLLLAFESLDRLAPSARQYQFRDYDDLRLLISALDKNPGDEQALDTDALERALVEVILGNPGAEGVRPVPEAAHREVASAIRERLARCWEQVRDPQDGATCLRDAVGPLTSFRDVDRTVDFVGDLSAQIMDRMRAHGAA